MKKRIINYPEPLEEVRTRYEHDGAKGKFKTYLLLQTRRLKEDYFTAQNENTLLQNKDLMRSTDFVSKEDDEFTLFVNPVIMNRLLEETPISDILEEEFKDLPPEVQTELRGLTWMQAFRNFLERLSENFGGLGSGKNLLIMLTGGGSLMRCVSDAVKKRFPDAEIYEDHTAISAIGKGMAYWAPDKIRAMDFEKAYTAFVERTEIDKDNDEVNIVNRALANAFLECVGGMANDVVQEERDAVIFGVEQWRDYQCRSYDIPDKVESHMRDWCKQTGVPTFVSNIEKQIDELKKRLNRDFISCVLDPLNMGSEELLKNDDKVFLSDSQRILKKLFDNLINFIVEHYKEHGIWSQFPNGNKGIFSNPRPNWLNANLDALNEWLNGESQATRNVCVELFCTREFQVTDDFESTFLNLFINEGRFDLENLMKERVKAILGKLVLEEYLEDE